MAAQKLRYRNKSEVLQVLYDERGTKREVVPGGTIKLTKAHASKYRFLELVPASTS